jgi:hypothetical protein
MPKTASRKAPAGAQRKDKARSKASVKKGGSGGSNGRWSRRASAATRKARSTTLTAEQRRLAELVCEERKIRLDQLAELSERPIGKVEDDVEHLMESGFLEAVEILVKEKKTPWLTPTRECLRQAGLVHSIYRTLPTIRDLNLSYLRVATRIHYASQMKGWDWSSPRVASPQRGKHLPDGILKRGKDSIAIAIEVSTKPRVIRRAMSELSKAHAKVHYHCDEEAQKRVEEVKAEGGFENVFVRDLPVDHLWLPEAKLLDGGRARL